MSHFVELDFKRLFLLPQPTNRRISLISLEPAPLWVPMPLAWFLLLGSARLSLRFAFLVPRSQEEPGKVPPQCPRPYRAARLLSTFLSVLTTKPGVPRQPRPRFPRSEKGEATRQVHAESSLPQDCKQQLSDY